MESKFAFCFLLLSSSFFVPTEAVKPYEELTKVLSDKGYHAMSLTLEAVNLEALIPTTQFTNCNTTFTLFCPKDQAFYYSKYPQPPLTLLKYHIVPFKIDKDSTEASFAHGSKVDTLLRGHPLVLTSMPGTLGYASLNLVKVREWNVYEDERLIVHGVGDFFDPAYQTLRYPQYDAVDGKDVPSRRFSIII